jgi:hypothetical protein
VGLRPDPGRDADEHVLRAVEEAVEALDLGERVADHVPDSGRDRAAKLGLGLVVAVQVDAVRLEPRPQRHVQLAAGGDVDREALLGADPVGGGERRRLAREQNLEVVGAGGECLAVGAGAGADVVLGVDVGGRAQLARYLDQVAAADLEPPGLVHAAAKGEHVRALDGVDACRGAAHRSGNDDQTAPGT